MGMKVEGMVPDISTKGGRSNNMKLIEVILRDVNLEEAIKRVKSNKVLNAKLNKKKNKENSQNKRKSLIKVNE